MTSAQPIHAASGTYGPPAPAPEIGERGSDGFIRKVGRELLMAVYGALRTVKMYPPDNPVVQKALDDLVRLTNDLYRREQEVDIRCTGEFIFINGTRLRLDLDNYATFSRIISAFREAGAGLFRVRGDTTPRDWVVFLTVLQAPEQGDPDARLQALGDKLTAATVTVFELGPFSAADAADAASQMQAKEAAKRTYAQSVSVTKEVINSVRMGKSPNIKKIKRVVQGIVDQILNEETSLIGLTTLRDYDEYTFTHSVNVCIFSVALGRKVGLTRLQLYDLGVGALMHDVGKARVPLDILNKPGSLTEDEWRTVCNHPWLGVLQLFQMRGQNDIPYRAMVVAFEHHKKTDLTGYPRHVRPRELSIYSKVVAVSDAFDAATSRRAYQTVPLSPADVLQEMRINPRRGMDQVLVKAFMSLVGHYPVGTLVVLDTFELALVHAANPSPDAISRPIVKIVSDERGNVLFPGALADLTDRDAAGVYKRTIIKVADPDRYGIRVSDYYI
ncbi:MAG TPA: HD domain-containing phosphohydrolase [Gemmatimonadaceae bacterium]|nr:HD domain-containing phosphohydrolase [Gemmatimonadaceae bacterium]